MYVLPIDCRLVYWGVLKLTVTWLPEAVAPVLAWWLERSVTKGKAWTVVSPRIGVPSSAVVTWAKTADYADGPGRLARACVRLGAGAAFCGAAMTLRASAGRDTGAAAGVSYVRRQVSSTGSVFCTGRLSSTTSGKTSTSSVRAYVGDFAAAAMCTGALETSANGGRTWQVVSAVLDALQDRRFASRQESEMQEVRHPVHGPPDIRH